jgi:hypothetical protein
MRDRILRSAQDDMALGQQRTYRISFSSLKQLIS